MNLIKSTGTFSFFTIISRLLGYIRDILIAVFLGAGPLADAFFVAFRIPNTFRRLFSEGTFNAAFVPSYSSVLHSKKKSKNFANSIFNLLVLGLLAFVLIVEILMPLFVFLIAPGFESDYQKMELAITLTRITFPFLMFISLASFFSAILFAWLFGFVLKEYTGLEMTGSLYVVDDFGEHIYIQWKNLVLPAIVLGIRPLAVVSQLMRNSLLEVLNQDYITTAKAKGLSQTAVIGRHALKNSLNPVVTAISGWFASMLAGAVFVEFIFGWNGIGKEIVDALNKSDLPVIMGTVIVIASLFIVINIFVDILYGWLDPKIRV